MLQAELKPFFQYDLPIDQDPIHAVMNRRVPWAVDDGVFSRQLFGTGSWPEQGWKLHVSATPISAVRVLEAALDVLLAEGARFKVVSTISRLLMFNDGSCGITQIGKFITVYPSDDTQAVRLASRLDEVTRGERGPRVPSDRPLRPDSLVHYRYGAMISRPEAESAGNDAGGTFDLLDPSGRLTDDVRLPYYQPPSELVSDPFEVAGVFVPRERGESLLNGRYIVCESLAQAPRGGVFRAIDMGVKPARLCLLKESWHDVSLDAFGRDARDWSVNEADVLSRLGGNAFVPQLYDSFELDGNRYIAIEYIEGTPLDVMLDEHYESDRIASEDLADIGLATARALAYLHEEGIIFRDFKPANVVQTPDGDYRLIDFGVAYEYQDSQVPTLSIGTPPYYSPEQFAGEHPSPADDIFSWGAALYHMAGGDASFADMPNEGGYPEPFARRPIAEYRADLPAPLAQVIDRAVAWNVADRYSTMTAAHDALAAAVSSLETSVEVESNGAATPSLNGVAERGPASRVELNSATALGFAREVGDALCDAAEERDGGFCWATRTEFSEQTGHNPDLYAGAAGIGLYLAELAHATGDERYADTARRTASWLAGPAWARGRAQHGLHCGEPGVAYFFVRLAQLLDAPGYVTAAELRMRRLRGAPAGTVDLIYGTAGTILGLLHLHAATGASEYLADATAAGDLLVQAAERAPNDVGCFWNVASAAPGGPVSSYLGLMHGAAGIGLALARLGHATGNARYLDTAKDAADMLLGHTKHSSPRLPAGVASGEAMAWPRFIGDSTDSLQAHCHGAGGVGQFFVRLDRIAPDPRYREAAAGAARMTAVQLDREQRSGVCHGVSGIGHALLDFYQHLGDPCWLAMAGSSGSRLQRFRHGDRPGIYTMQDDGAFSPDLMLGYAGVGSFYLRLANASEAGELVLG